MTSVLNRFQIWGNSGNNIKLSEISDSIHEVVDAIVGVQIEVNGGGVLKITRGAPFIQPLPVDPANTNSRRYVGNLEIKYYMI